jgi:hypothetical protein
MIAVVMLVAMLLPATTSAISCNPIRGSHPMIFVHGSSGSATQFESQAMRFASNGYPHEYIYVLEYDSTFSINTIDAVYASLDALIAKAQKETGAAKVDILAHSLGTTVMLGGTVTAQVTPGYLNSSAERAAKVNHYVNIDGRTATALPGTVVGVPIPTLALWAGIPITPDPDHLRTIVGATNVIIPNQTHVQTATSAESFVNMYQFFTGKDAVTSYILPELPALVMLAGRATYFPQNTGIQNATLEIWRVNGDTGYRIGNKPEKVYNISGDGAWGPFRSHGGWYYEFVVYSSDGSLPLHFYAEPYMRSDYLIRIQTSTALNAYLSKSDHTTNLNILRDKEIWGDQGIENDDSLEINGIEVVYPVPFAITKRVIAAFVFDQGPLLPPPYYSNGVPDGVSHLGVPIYPFFALSFLTGVDLVIPGATPPDSTIPVVLTPRGGGGKTQVINVPNWASSGDAVTLHFHDYVQDINSWDDYVRYLLYLLFQKWF